MRRKLFTLAAAVSAVLCAGACVLFIRSTTLFEMVGVLDFPRPHGLASADGSWWLLLRSDPPPPAQPWKYRCLKVDWDDGGVLSVDPSIASTRTGPGEAFGFAAFDEALVEKNLGYVTGTTAHYEPPAHWLVVGVPYWFTGPVAGVLPYLWVARFRRRRERTRSGLCPDCGYDLRATPGRCPECGTVPASAKGAT